MLRRWLSMTLGVAGLILLGLAASSYYSSPSGPALAVEEADLNLTNIIPGQETPVVFQLRNDSCRPIRVVGQAEC